MVMPRAFASGAASIWSYALASPPNLADSTVVIAAVRVVLPWSTWPMVPTLTCGLVRSNLPFAIQKSPEKEQCPCMGFTSAPGSLVLRHGQRRGSGRRRPTIRLFRTRSDDRLGDVLRSFAVML